MASGRSRVERAIRELAWGRIVMLSDSKRGQTDLVLAGQFASTASIAFMVRHTSGFVGVAMCDTECLRLQFPPMWALNESGTVDGYTVTVDAVAGITTGISAADRASTIRAIADPCSCASDFSRPGHVAPIRAHRGGVVEKPGSVEAVVELLRCAGMRPVGAMAELVSELVPTTMAGPVEGAEFARKHGLSFISVDDVVAYCSIRGASLPARLTAT
ncbi:3,4-dihydroxy-2-butanone-4-phosphate synthase [Nocardia sp. R16R-3T]